MNETHLPPQHPLIARHLASLTPLDQRMLEWLLHYPFQRAEDLVIGVAMTKRASRPTIYRRIAALSGQGLLESILPALAGDGKRYYYLSNSGLHILATILQTPAAALAHRFGADEVGLLRLLPRLVPLLPLQNVVNGLVTSASDALTSAGHRPMLVRWNWLRDYASSFQYGDQTLRYTADGALALCIRTCERDGSACDHWLNLLLLSTGLLDERLMAFRLSRILLWRECPARKPLSQFMPPVVILALSERQRDHWLRAAENVSHRYALAPLTGALTCLPDDRGVVSPGNPWMFAWQTLATQSSCHLQDLLAPLPSETLPDGLLLESTREPHGSTPLRQEESKPRLAPRRLKTVVARGLFSRGQEAFNEGSKPVQLALLVLSLSPGLWDILSLLFEHPFLAEAELSALLHLDVDSIRRMVFDLHWLGCLERVQTRAGKRWHLLPHGVRFLAAAHRVNLRNIASLPLSHSEENESDRPSVRGELALLRSIEHTASISRFFASLAQATDKAVGTHPRPFGQQGLLWWESSATCRRTFTYQGQEYHLKPDALAAYRAGERVSQFWLDWASAAASEAELSSKYATYALFVRSREWAREGPILPRLLSVIPGKREPLLRRIIQRELAQTPGLAIYTTTAEFLAQHGPLSAIWRPVTGRDAGGRTQVFYSSQDITGGEYPP